MAFTITQKQVAQSINRIDAKTLRAAIQTAAVNVIGHAMEHGSSPLVEQLMDRMDGVPMLAKLAPALSTFLQKQGPFVYGKATGWQFSKTKRAALVEAGYEFDTFAAECPMWDDASKADKTDKPFDLMKEVEKLIERAIKKESQGQCVEAGMIRYLQAVKSKYVADVALAKARETVAKAEADRVATPLVEVVAG